MPLLINELGYQTACLNDDQPTWRLAYTTISLHGDQPTWRLAYMAIRTLYGQLETSNRQIFFGATNIENISLNYLNIQQLGQHVQASCLVTASGAGQLAYTAIRLRGDDDGVYSASMTHDLMKTFGYRPCTRNQFPSRIILYRNNALTTPMQVYRISWLNYHVAKHWLSFLFFGLNALIQRRIRGLVALWTIRFY